MTRNKLLENRLMEVFINGKWIANTNYKEQIEDTNWQQAIQRFNNLNSIALLTYHINYYLEGLLNVLHGGNLEIKDKFSFDMPELNSEKDWNELVLRFLNNAESFAQKVGQLDETLFDQSFVEERYGTYLRNIEGVIEHSYYHLGQIVLIKKITNRNFD